MKEFGIVQRKFPKRQEINRATKLNNITKMVAMILARQKKIKSQK
jgi:hypothetical protein